MRLELAGRSELDQENKDDEGTNIANVRKKKDRKRRGEWRQYLYPLSERKPMLMKARRLHRKQTWQRMSDWLVQSRVYKIPVCIANHFMDN